MPGEEVGSINNLVMENGWTVYEDPSEVVPNGDLKPHQMAGGICWCNPFIDNGAIIHNAMDKREYYESDSIHLKRDPS